MLSLWGFLKDNKREVFQSLFIISAFIVPGLIDLRPLLDGYLQTFKNDGWYILIYVLSIILGAKAIPFLLSGAVVAFCCHRNKNIVLNRGNYYHNYPLWWYRYCSLVLGIKSCNLVLVPIYMQFKLVINAVFSDFPLIESDYPLVKENSKSKVVWHNVEQSEQEINVILEDTYKVDISQLPGSKRSLKTVKISRDEFIDGNRRYNPLFCEAVNSVIRSIPTIEVVNIFATTNPKHTIEIARKVFLQAKRGNVNALYIYNQDDKVKATRAFEEKGHKVYSYKK